MALRQQVMGMIESCEKVLETIAKGKDANLYVENQTVELANKMIQTAQAANADDAVLKTVKLSDRMVTWQSLLAAMRVVYNSLPEEKPRI